MYFSDEIILIDTDTSGTDAIGLQVETETGRTTVYGDIKSVSREESLRRAAVGTARLKRSCCAHGITAGRNTHCCTV